MTHCTSEPPRPDFHQSTQSPRRDRKVRGEKKQSETSQGFPGSAYILNADGQVRLEVAEIFGQVVPVMVVGEQPLKESQQLQGARKQKQNNTTDRFKSADFLS